MLDRPHRRAAADGQDRAGHRRRRCRPARRRRLRPPTTSPRPSGPRTSTPSRAPCRSRCRRARCSLGFAAKGCGMISPNMATMLCFVTCDAAVRADDWTRLLHEAVDGSFNLITVDGQESTNDTVLGFCNGASGVKPGEEGLALLGAGARRRAALRSPCPSSPTARAPHARCGSRSPARPTRAKAEAVARAVANSPLVKTAFYGRDANWGRIMQAIGQALGREGRHAPAGRHRLRGRADRRARGSRRSWTTSSRAGSTRSCTSPRST